MNYSKEIEAYSEGQMSAVERMAFEHELEDNATLQAEWETDQLVQDLLGQAAGQLSVEDILAIKTPIAAATEPKAVALLTAPVNANYKPLALVALLCCTCFYYILEYGDFQQQPTIEDRSKSIAVPEEIPVAAQLKKKSVKKEELKVFQEYQEEPRSRVKATSTVPTTKKVGKRRPIALNEQHSIHNGLVAAKTKKALTNTSPKSATAISRTSDVEFNEPLKSGGTPVKLIADNSITLKPGFHAPAGTSFSATIGDDK